ncbi:MAG TPA: response regulator [Nitrososphaeraceae archaeon]|nr:response regulator [Nitrososphaeraceae archaeon]
MAEDMREYDHTQATKRILIVDDEPDITFVFKIGLEDNGFVVDTFNDPQLAISNFKTNLYDLLLIDIGIPKMNGFELYREIRKIDDKVKACFFTASEAYYMDLVKKYQMSHVNCFITKPIAIEELVKRISKIMAMDAGY